ncbi:radical SAM protein [Candidatus Villigracilis saccharophilus]|uniref:radical SAM protein n=1 Tax=Candidatus Villigracilis saccharophilus TaxID=3140684 RepID=UPI0031EB5E06
MLPFFRRPITEVLVKPAGPDCNLDCEYCFYIEKLNQYPSRTTRMSDAVLEAMIQQLMAQNVPQISIGWQGGEPTLMGLPFYRKAVDLMTRHGRGQSVSNGLQTNGVLIDHEWAKFFRDYHFLIGLVDRWT